MASLLKAQQNECEENDGDTRDGGEQNEPGPLTLSHSLLHQPLNLNLLHTRGERYVSLEDKEGLCS